MIDQLYDDYLYDCHVANQRLTEADWMEYGREVHHIEIPARDNGELGPLNSQPLTTYQHWVAGVLQSEVLGKQCFAYVPKNVLPPALEALRVKWTIARAVNLNAIANSTLTAEQRSERTRKGAMSRSPEQRSEWARMARELVSPEQRSEAMRKRAATLGPERLSEIARSAQAKISQEQRSERARKGNASRTPEQRSEAIRKGHETRRLRRPGLP